MDGGSFVSSVIEVIFTKPQRVYPVAGECIGSGREGLLLPPLVHTAQYVLYLRG